jgi:cobalt/nickel transport system permease protein
LAGLILGWAVFPAMLVALLLQVIFFGYGGLTTIGVNTLNMALPGALCFMVFGRFMNGGNARTDFLLGFAAGTVAIALSCGLLSLTLLTAGRNLLVLSQGVFLAHIPLMIMEGVVTGSAVAFLRKVRPETFSLGAGADWRASHVRAT